MFKFKSILFALILLTVLASDLFPQYQYFGFTSIPRKDFETLTLMTLSTRSDTAYQPSPLLVTYDIGTVRVQLNVTTASTSDSMWIQAYGSADDSTYTQITSPAFTTVTTTGSQVITISACPKYLKFKYLVMGSASAFKFGLKAVAKYGY